MGFDQWLSHDNFFEMDPWLSRNGGPPEQFPGESSEIIIRETIQFIDNVQQSEQPFFAVVWFGSPHEPYSGLEEDLALYDDLPEEYAEQLFRLTSMETGQPTRRPLKEVLQERYAEITAMDRSIGQLRKFLTDEDLRENTLLWYCGDNGTPGDGIVTSPFRGQKALVYEGGIRVPGIIEWPGGISEPRVTDVNSVTSDILPTICELVGQPLPDRPLDGISLQPLLDDDMTQRPTPICFWNYNTSREAAGGDPWIESELQTGTTPLVKMMDGRFTRNFRNHHHNSISDADFTGSRAILGNRYKLVIDGQGQSGSELFDMHNDQAEEHNLIDTRAETAADLSEQLRTWQESVLESLTGADYR